MRELTATDEAILSVAQKLFLEQGILKTEMRDIAEYVGCSRSTLYRHFGGKEVILIYLAARALDKIMRAALIPDELHFSCGFDALVWQVNALVECMIVHVDEITFIRDFDCVFTHNYPSIPESDDFIQWLHSLGDKMCETSLLNTLARGMEDGSIRKLENMELTGLTLGHSCFGLAERILPREQQNVAEHGYGKELLRHHIVLMLEGLKGDE